MSATQTDVRDYGALQAAVDDGVAQLGRPDIVVANVGIGSLGASLATMDEKTWQDTDVLHQVSTRRQHDAVGVEGETDPHALVPGVAAGDEILAAVLDPLHRAARRRCPFTVRVTSSSLMTITGTRLCPPARTFASSPSSASIPTAASTDAGRW